jgi:hypothetical protein
MYGRNNPKIYSKLHDKFGLIVFLLFIFSGLSSFSSSFGVLLLVSLIIAVVGAPFWLIAWLISKSAKGKARQKQNDYDYYTQHYSQSDAKAGMTVTGLTKAVPKRRKIIQKFNQKYDLYLTDEEIDRIVDASYMSNCWEREILDMDQKYDTISQWYRGDSAWLRAYLHVFPVQNVTSDFESQRSICLDTFYQVFSEIDPGKYESMESCVREINHRFMTNFDDITFSVAHRFLADNGYKFELPHFDVRGVKSDIDRLKDKYDQETASSGSRSGYEKMRQR